MRENDSTVNEKPQSNLTRWGIYALILVLVFLAGFLPMWLQKREVSQELDNTRQQLNKSEIKNSLTAAIVEANRGAYEPARQNTSEFYTRLRAEIDKGDAGAYSKEERAQMNSIFDNRDQMITLLAQRDPASVERLTDVYSNYRQALGQPRLPSAAPPLSNEARQPTQ